MTKLANLIEALTELGGREVSALSAIAREIAEAGYMPSSSTNEDGIGLSAAANLLIASNTPYMPERPALSVPIFRGLKRLNYPAFWCPSTALAAVSAAETFGDAIEAFLRDAGRIRRWFVEGQQTSQDAVDYIANYTCAMRLTFTTSFLPGVTIKVARAEEEPAFCLEFWSTEETVKLMPNDCPPDRKIEISVGLPTLLTFAGAVLGRDLIEVENNVCDQRLGASRSGALAATAAIGKSRLMTNLNSEESPGGWGAVEDAGGPA